MSTEHLDESNWDDGTSHPILDRFCFLIYRDFFFARMLAGPLFSKNKSFVSDSGLYRTDTHFCLWECQIKTTNSLFPIKGPRVVK